MGMCYYSNGNPGYSLPLWVYIHSCLWVPIRSINQWKSNVIAEIEYLITLPSKELNVPLLLEYHWIDGSFDYSYGIVNRMWEEGYYQVDNIAINGKRDKYPSLQFWVDLIPYEKQRDLIHDRNLPGKS